MDRQYYRRNVATASPDATAVELADVMEYHAVGSVVIVDDAERPIGIVTDRDLTCRVVAKALDPEKTAARDVMSQPLITSEAKEPLERIAARMREAGVRRIPIVTDGKLSGIVALDDLLFRLGRELQKLIDAVDTEMESSRKRGKKEQRQEEWEEKLSEVRGSVERASRDAVDFLSRELESLRSRISSRRDQRRARGGTDSDDESPRSES